MILESIVLLICPLKVFTKKFLFTGSGHKYDRILICIRLSILNRLKKRVREHLR